MTDIHSRGRGEDHWGLGQLENHGGVRKDLSVRDSQEPRQGERTGEEGYTSRGSSCRKGGEVEEPTGE